jgi:two-component system sensor histidine kinase and response regulator WspE
MTDFSHFSMSELFQAEADSQTRVLTSSLLSLERRPDAAEDLEACMRAAHSLKGAARIVQAESAVALAHAMEDLFVAAQQGRVRLNQEAIDLLLRGVDLMAAAAAPSADTVALAQRVESYVAELEIMLGADSPVPARDAEEHTAEAAAPPPEPTKSDPEPGDRSLRVTVDNLNRLVGLAGENLVGSRQPLAQSLARLRRLQQDAAQAIENLADAAWRTDEGGPMAVAVSEARRRMRACETFLAERMADLEVADLRNTRTAHRLYDQALACRMQPFGDGASGLPRMTRDLARSLGKQARLVIGGAATQVDRDILACLEAPLAHLVRNAIDHGLESPEQRRAAGKPAEGVVQVAACHVGGVLQVTVSDDGRGVDLPRLRAAVVERGLAAADTVDRLSEAELLDFLFLPGFTLREQVSEISGRGVGLDAVRDMLKQVRGQVRVTTQPQAGARFQLQLPLTLSVVRALVADIGGEAYAFPLAQVVRAISLPRSALQTLEGRQHVEFDGRQIGLVSGHQVLGAPQAPSGDDLSILVLGEGREHYGLVVDRFLGGAELVVQPLDVRLGKLRDISAAALTADGETVMIVDVEDMVRSMERLSEADRLAHVQVSATVAQEARKRILVVDDSLTVRELQRKLLDHHGYEVQVAVDGIDAWASMRDGRFDLVVTDVDMPRMDGVELVAKMRCDPRLKTLPVVILSYKDREDDRRRGLEAGADYYLTKGSFQNDALLNAVVDLIGKAG